MNRIKSPEKPPEEKDSILEVNASPTEADPSLVPIAGKVPDISAHEHQSVKAKIHSLLRKQKKKLSVDLDRLDRYFIRPDLSDPRIWNFVEDFSMLERLEMKSKWQSLIFSPIFLCESKTLPEKLHL